MGVLTFGFFRAPTKAKTAATTGAEAQDIRHVKLFFLKTRPLSELLTFVVLAEVTHSLVPHLLSDVFIIIFFAFGGYS